MLRSKSVTPGKRLDRLVSWIATGSVLAIALAVTLLRGPAASAEKPVEVARRSDSSTNASSHASNSNQDKSLFARESVDPAIIPHAAHGAYLVRLGEILRLPKMQPHVDAINRGWTVWLRNLVDWPAANDDFIDLREIEWIAGAMLPDGAPMEEGTTVTVGTPTDPSETSQEIAFGRIVIRMAHAGDWQAAVLKHVPGSSLETRNGESYVQLPAAVFRSFPSRSIGWGGMRLQFPDDKTILLYPACFEPEDDDVDVDVIVNAIDFSTKPAAQPYAWADAWRAVEGGLITMVSDSGDFVWCTLPIEQSEWPPFAAPLFKDVNYYAIGCDWTEQSQQIAARAHGICADQTTAAAVDLAASTLLNRWPELFPKGVKEYGAHADRVLRFISGVKLAHSPAAADQHFVHATGDAPLNPQEFLGMLRQMVEAPAVQTKNE